MNQLRITLLAAVCAALLGAVPAPIHLRGTIAHVTANAITVMTAKGAIVVSVAPKTRVAAVVPGSRADIKPGTFIGTANMQGNGIDRALEVVVFPDAMRGTGEGNYAWDLSPKSGSSSMMTNGTVAQGRQSMMTNGTVAHTMRNGAMILTVTYKGGQQRINVPANAPIVRIEPGSRALIHRGAHVFIVASGDMTHPVAMRIIVGKDGAVPPM